MFLSQVSGVVFLALGGASAGALAATLVVSNYWLSRFTTEQHRQTRFRDRIRARLNGRPRNTTPAGN